MNIYILQTFGINIIIQKFVIYISNIIFRYIFIIKFGQNQNNKKTGQNNNNTINSSNK